MLARILQPTAENLRFAADTLTRGEVVGMPTETVYGLAGRALDENAVASIFETKDRPTFDPLIVHVSEETVRPEDRGVLDRLAGAGIVDVERWNLAARAAAERLAREFWPGPFTMVLPRGPDIPDLVTSGLDTVAVRVPRHPVAQSLLAACGFPLAAPSANRFGRISPTRAEDVVEELGDRIAIVLDGGPCEIGVESTVVALEPDGSATLLRPGGIPLDAVARAIGSEVRTDVRKTYGPGAPASSPGTIEGHYAPSKPLQLFTDIAPDRSAIPPDARRVGLLVVFGDAALAANRIERALGIPVDALALSPGGDEREAARRLFGSLRRLDESAADVLLAEMPRAETGLLHAVADRLRRAARRER